MSHPNTIIGKHFTVSVADGRAEYEVNDLHAMEMPDGTYVGFAHCILVDGGMDGYCDQIIGEANWIPEDAVRAMVRHYDAMRELFSSPNRRRQS